MNTVPASRQGVQRSGLAVIGVLDVDTSHSFTSCGSFAFDEAHALHLSPAGHVVPDDVRGALDDVTVLRRGILEPRGERMGAEAELADLELRHVLRERGGGPGRDDPGNSGGRGGGEKRTACGH